MRRIHLAYLVAFLCVITATCLTGVTPTNVSPTVTTGTVEYSSIVTNVEDYLIYPATSNRYELGNVSTNDEFVWTYDDPNTTQAVYYECLNEMHLDVNECEGWKIRLIGTNGTLRSYVLTNGFLELIKEDTDAEGK